MQFKLSPKEQEIIIALFHYRSMTVVQLTQKFTKVQNPTKVQKSNTHNYLKRLKGKKLIQSKKIEANVGDGSIYYLSNNGLEAAKSLLDIDYSQIGDGFVQASRPTLYSDLSHENYKPPLEQIGHHLLCTDALLKLDLYLGPSRVSTRTSTYSSRVYENNGYERILRPDAEFKLDDAHHYFIEIDMVTENYKQLVAKFENYKNYFESIEVNQLPQAIFFVVRSSETSPGFKRRWMTILTAYLNVMTEAFSHLVNLVMVSIDELDDSVYFEIMLKIKFNTSYLPKTFSNHVDSNYYLIGKSDSVRDNFHPFGFLYTDSIYSKYYFIHYAHQYESLIYGNFLYFVRRMNELLANVSTTAKLCNPLFEQLIVRFASDKNISLNFPPDTLSTEMMAILELLKDHTKIIMC